MEIWKDISGYVGSYKVSNLGRVKSLERTIQGKKKKIRYVKDAVLKPCISTHGYWFIGLSKNGKAKYFKIHRLIAKYFIPNPENKPQINHKNGIKIDNRLENLEWCTHSENMRHALDTKLRVMPSGSKVYNSKLTEEIVIEARKRYAIGQISFEKLAIEYGVTKSVMMHAVKGQNWKHLNKKYPPPKGKDKYRFKQMKIKQENTN